MCIFYSIPLCLTSHAKAVVENNIVLVDAVSQCHFLLYHVCLSVPVQLCQFACCRYSSLLEADKAAAFSLWRKKWNQFIEQSLEMSSDHSMHGVLHSTEL